MTLTPETGAADAPVVEAARAAAYAIPPLWPLATSVAVNPFLGQSEEPLATVAARLSRVGGIPVTPPRDEQRARLRDGGVTDADLQAALDASPHGEKPADVPALRAALAQDAPPPEALPTVAELARDATGTDWPAIVADRFGTFAAAHFDVGQALWTAHDEDGLWAAWRSWAMHDLTPEIAGLAGFAQRVTRLPSDPAVALVEAVRRLGLSPAALPTYFHALLASLGGWAQYARHIQFEAERDGGRDDVVLECLLVRLLWDDALLEHAGAAIAADWSATRSAHAVPVTPTPAQIVDEIVQEAVERAAQRDLAHALARTTARSPEARPALQAAFCIDVRSEVFRRALESVAPQARTLGFAGFFGLGTAHRRLASDIDEARLPVLLRPDLASRPDVDASTDAARRFADRAARAWGRFKLAAVSSFAFVEAAGPIYVGRLLRDALGLRPAAVPSDPAPRLDPEPDAETRIDTAEGVLRGLSLTDGFARLVVIAGHGAGVVNNPHRSALHCGACGGHSGEVNARLLARLLNDEAVRAGLARRGIRIPDDTRFVGALHDTTADALHLYDADLGSKHRHAEDLDRARRWFDRAGAVARTERALRLPRARSAAAVARRGRDWSEVRPEWGLAGCRAFVAAPRMRTRGTDLGGRAFLHDYDWQADEGDAVLETILTAPVVVASWISLQYYGSTVAPAAFGAGNKLLHNVVGGIGVLEGNGGVLRAGLPRQSVDDGDGPVHEPLRLSVFVQAPREAIDGILSRHDGVRTLFERRWLHLFALGDDGGVARWSAPGEWIEEVADADRSARSSGRGPLRAVG